MLYDDGNHATTHGPQVPSFFTIYRILVREFGNHSMAKTRRLPSAAAVRSSCLIVGLARGLSNFCAAAQDVPNARANSANVLTCSTNCNSRLNGRSGFYPHTTLDLAGHRQRVT